MQVISNSIIFLLSYFFLQIFLYRFLKININKLPIILIIIIVSIAVGFYSYSIEMLMNLINFNLIIVCFYIIMPAIISHGPGLTIIDLIENKKINKKQKLKKFFLKGKVGKAIERRLNINISSNLMKFDNGGFYIRKNTKLIIVFFNIIKKIYRLKSDAY